MIYLIASKVFSNIGGPNGAASSNTSQGLAMASKRPTQPPSEGSTLTCLAREPIAELHDDGVQVRVVVPERLVANELVGRHIS